MVKQSPIRVKEHKATIIHWDHTGLWRTERSKFAEGKSHGEVMMGQRPSKYRFGSNNGGFKRLMDFQHLFKRTMRNTDLLLGN